MAMYCQLKQPEEANVLIVSNEKTTGIMLSAWAKQYHKVFVHGLQQVDVPTEDVVDVGQHDSVLFQPSTTNLRPALIKYISDRARKVLVLATTNPKSWPDVPKNVRIELIPSSAEGWLKFFL